MSIIQDSASEADDLDVGKLILLAELGNSTPPTDALRNRIISEVNNGKDHKMTTSDVSEASQMMSSPWLREDDEFMTAVLKVSLESASKAFSDIGQRKSTTYFPMNQISLAYHAIHGLDHIPMEFLEVLFKHPRLFDGKGEMLKTLKCDNRLERITAKWNLIQIVGSLKLKLGASYPDHWPELNSMLRNQKATVPSDDMEEPGDWYDRLKCIKERLKHQLGGGDDFVHEAIVLPHFDVVSYLFATDSSGRPVPVPDSLCCQEHLTFRYMQDHFDQSLWTLRSSGTYLSHGDLILPSSPINLPLQAACQRRRPYVLRGLCQRFLEKRLQV